MNKTMSQDDVEIIEEGFQKDGIGSREEIILRHIRKISDLIVQELTPSYWERKPIATQGGVMMSEIYHEDKREAYCNAVDFLTDMIMPYADETLKTFYTDWKELETLLFEDAKKSELSQSKWILKKIELRRMMFQEINVFFHRDNFFKATSYGEGA